LIYCCTHSNFTQSKTISEMEFCCQLAKDHIGYSYAIVRGERGKRKRPDWVVASICGVEWRLNLLAHGMVKAGKSSQLGTHKTYAGLFIAKRGSELIVGA
jgi:hypothetical protein